MSIWHPIWARFYDTWTEQLESAVLAPRRTELLADLTGQVLDVGAGTGANLPYFRAAERVIAAEPDSAMRRRLMPKLDGAAAPTEVVAAAAESLPYGPGSFDAVVFTCTLCTVHSVGVALAEARRTLRPGGRLVVLEHVRGYGRVAAWQDRVTPLWQLLCMGCHPNRNIRACIEQARFRFERINEFQVSMGGNVAVPVLQAVAVAA